MLACGRNCQPTKITREIQLFESSTRPAKVATDAGDGIIKGLGNPQGPVSLVSELIAAELGTWFGLDIPPFAIIRNCEIEIPMIGRHGSMQPPMFFSKFLDGSPRDGGTAFLQLLDNPADISRLVVFDTWIRNVDRYVHGSANSDNLIYATVTKGKKYSLAPIDHSHCFVDNDFDSELPCDELTQDPLVYGRFPEFEAFIKPENVSEAINRLNELNRNFVVQCINSVPAEWELSTLAGQNLIDLICDRAEYVASTIAMKIVEQPELPGV